MRKIHSTLLALTACSISGCATSPKPRNPLPLAPDAISHPDPARIYLLNGDTAALISMGLGNRETDGLAHVTILGAIEKPGVYYFKDKAAIESIITAAIPRKTAEHCGSACLTMVTILSSQRLKDRNSYTINYEKYIAAKGPTRLSIELQGGEVIHVPEWF